MAQMIASRFAGLSRGQAFSILLVLLLAMALSALFAISRPAAPSVPSKPVATVAIMNAPKAEANGNDDLLLYDRINARIAKGERYHAVAADEQRRDGYPLRPFVTMRLPTLAWVSTTLEKPIMTALLFGLLAATMLVWWRRLSDVLGANGGRFTAVGTIFASAIVVFSPQFHMMHEVWAGLLLALAFGAHRPNRWGISALAAGLALFIRELSLPFILLMIAFAMFERRWREVGTLSAILALFAAFMSWHAHQVLSVTLATDPASPGWSNIGGWPAVVRPFLYPGPLRFLPTNVGAIFVVLSLFGWLSWRSRTGLFGTLLFAGYSVFFMLFCRPDNFYWGFLMVPTFLVGLAFVPRALNDLHTAIVPKLDFAPA